MFPEKDLWALFERDFQPYRISFRRSLIDIFGDVD